MFNGDYATVTFETMQKLHLNFVKLKAGDCVK